MKQPLVSIIMPIYNASNFLKESLGGLVQQTLSNIEIICVNDGSRDNSLDIVKQYALNDCRIKIIDKPNGGYGHAMNAGLKIATGEYIGILEPDDFEDINMYEILYNTAKEYKADVVKSNYYEYSQSKNSNTFTEVLEGFDYNTVCSAAINEKIVFMRPCIWSAIYKRELLIDNHIVFNETPGASYQDTAFAFKVWVCAERVVFIKDAFLHYRIDNENSSVNSSGKIFSICDEFQSIQSFLNEDKIKKDKYSKILQVLKLDTYNWNLGRITDEYKEMFRDQIALEFIKAEYENILDIQYFDEWRWEQVQNYIQGYRNGLGYYNSLVKRINDLENSHSYRVGHALMLIPGKVKRLLRGGK